MNGVDEALEFYEAHEERPKRGKKRERNQIYDHKLAGIDLSRHFQVIRLVDLKLQSIQHVSCRYFFW